MQAVGLQTYIWNNNLRSIFLLAAFPVLLLILLYAVELTLLGSGFARAPYGYYVTMGDQFAYAARLTLESAPLAIGVAVVWFIIAYFGNQTIIDMATGAAPVARSMMVWLPK